MTDSLSIFKISNEEPVGTATEFNRFFFAQRSNTRQFRIYDPGLERVMYNKHIDAYHAHKLLLLILLMLL